MAETDVVRLIFAAFIVTFCIILFIIYTGMRNRRLLLMREHSLTLAENQRKQDILRAVVQTEENERMRIARDLHDSLGPSLACVQHTLSRQAHVLADGHADELSVAANELNNIVEHFRTICFNLYPYSLQKYGLSESIRQFLLSITGVAGINLNLDNTANVAWMNNPTTSLQTMRVFQEVVNNVVKHSGCSKIDLRLFDLDSNYNIVISHNGKPFSDDDARQSSAQGQGMSSIEARLALINGQIHYGGFGGNATIEIKIPLHNGQNKDSYS